MCPHCMPPSCPTTLIPEEPWQLRDRMAMLESDNAVLRAEVARLTEKCNRLHEEREHYRAKVLG